MTNVQDIALVAERPWEGLGNDIGNSKDVDAILNKANLNWAVTKHQLFAEVNGVKVPTQRAALLRETDNEVMTVTGMEWKPMQNRAMIELFMYWAKEMGAKIETVGSLKGGRIIWALAALDVGFSLNGKDTVKSYVLMTSPHEVGRAIQIAITPIRIWCTNMMAKAFAAAEAQYRQSHVRDFDLSQAHNVVRMAKSNMEQLHMDAEALQGLKMSEFDNVRFLASFFQPAEEGANVDEHAKTLLNDVEQQNVNMAKALWALKKAPGAVEGNAWGTYNAVTYWADHLNGRERDARMFKSWLGNAGKIKEDARKQLLQLAA